MVSKFRSSNEYDISPFGCLKRGKQQLLSKSSESIFYAALEIRFAIEARAKEQLLSLEGIPKRIVNMWHAEKIMNEMGKRIDGASQSFRFCFRYNKQKIRPFTYIPISKSILIEYGKLGTLLHVQRKRISMEFIKEKKRWLKAVLKKIEETCKGHMLRPLEWKIRCSKCKQYIPWSSIHKSSGSIICNCGYKSSLMNKEMTMIIKTMKKSERKVELLQAERIIGEI